MAAAGMLPEYPAPPGNKHFSVKNVAGPASYTQVTTGTTPSGGQQVTAAHLGLVDIESCHGSLSDNGQYYVYPLFIANPAKGMPSIQLMWVTASGGAEVAGSTDLSARTVRLTAFGH